MINVRNELFQNVWLITGDCGVATATGNNGSYKFKLAHKAAYLCLTPHVETNKNTSLGQNIYLQKIEVSSDNPIAGTYDFSVSGLSTHPKSGASNMIILNTSGSGTQLGFPLTGINNPLAFANSAAYLVIAPGNHTLTVR